MTNVKKWTGIIGVGLAALLLAMLALPAFAAGIEAAPAAHRGGPGLVGPGGDEYLADALGVTAEELQAAQESAHEAAIEQAVDEGLITQAQADALLERSGLFGRHESKGFGGFLAGETIDHEALLADALGVSVAELQAAQETAKEAALQQAIDDGRITEEQADMMQAQEALKNYLQEQGLQDSMRSLYEGAVQDAVEAGVITQEQADAILSNMGRFSPFGGMRGFHGHGGMRGFRGFDAPGGDAPGGAFQRSGPAFNGARL